MKTVREEALDLLPLAARPIVRAFVMGEEAKRDHLVVYLSGAHAYGFPSPDSDVDLKAIHVAPTSSLVGLAKPKLSADVARVVDGVELDYTSNELGAVLAGVLGGNGNYIERLLGATPVIVDPSIAEARPIIRRALSRRVHHAYRGFATAQAEAFRATPSVKKLLYVLRTAATGTHLLATGEVVTDLLLLAEGSWREVAHELVARKAAGERTLLTAPEAARYEPVVERAFERLDLARETSCLPEEPANAAEVEAYLLAVRRAAW